MSSIRALSKISNTTRTAATQCHNLLSKLPMQWLQGIQDDLNFNDRILGLASLSNRGSTSCDSTDAFRVGAFGHAKISWTLQLVPVRVLCSLSDIDADMNRKLVIASKSHTIS
ncbi:hypothetical protein IAQ61_007235 [Plenodomus lingam]|uniref:uncharacterized protein n=1 Tax=Leptosphaeria maculans TaxID=5022 RepID=UPI0033171CCA|nr:hypothetical protein IAQ61_007235 [Plenodomus lingam]